MSRGTQRTMIKKDLKMMNNSPKENLKMMKITLAQIGNNQQ